MIVLAILLWGQTAILAALTGLAIYQGSKDPGVKASTVGATGFIFGCFIGLSAIAALVVGGLA